MEIKTTLLPGQNGTKHLQKQYGDKLVCVRYRYDGIRKKRLKTIELIISERDYGSSAESVGRFQDMAA